VWLDRRADRREHPRARAAHGRTDASSRRLGARLRRAVRQRRRYQPRFTYTLGELDHGLGPGIRRIKFEETIAPTILRTDSDRDLPTRGTVWVVEATGRVVRTEIQIGEVRDRLRAIALSTSFKQDEALHIYVPAADGYMMKETSTIKGTAYCTRFRRFTVRTVETIDVPKPN
jgi:hypothetical protein